MSQGGHIVKPSGRRKTWAIIYRDPAGIQQWEGKFKKRTEAQARLNEVLGAVDKGTYARPSSVTFERFADDWLAGRRQIRGSTESGYVRLSTSNSFLGSERLQYRLCGSNMLTRP